jgi:hypothetical protein
MSPTVGEEWELPLPVWYSRFFQFLFGSTNAADLGRRVHDVWYRVVVDMPVTSDDSLDTSNPFIRRLMRKHRPPDDVANSVDVWCTRAEMLIDFNPASLVEFDTCCV